MRVFACLCSPSEYIVSTLKLPGECRIDFAFNSGNKIAWKKRVLDLDSRPNVMPLLLCVAQQGLAFVIRLGTLTQHQ